MKKIYFKNLNEYFEQEITIEGFVDNIRDLQYVQFLVVRDTTGKVQVTIEKNENNSKLNEIVSNLTIESTVKITGTLLKNEKVKLNGMELIPNDIIVTSKCLEDLPLNYKDSKSALLDTRLNYRFLDLRSEKNILMFKVQTCMINAMRDFVLKRNFVEIHTPKFISVPSESGSNVFEVSYFNRKAYLAQSPQFYKQMAMCSGFENVFEIAPAFRAENSNSYRHATEFNSFDIEMSYLDNLEELMDFEENLFIAGLSAVKNKFGEKIYTSEVKEMGRVDVESQYIARVKEGFRAVVSFGLGTNYMGNYRSIGAGKTGTSQSFIDTDGNGVVDTETITVVVEYAGTVTNEGAELIETGTWGIPVDVSSAKEGDLIQVEITVASGEEPEDPAKPTIGGNAVDTAEAFIAAANSGVAIKVPTGWTLDGNTLKDADDNEYATFADYYTVELATDGTVTLQLNDSAKPTIGETVADKGDAIVVTDAAVALGVTNAKAGLWYGAQAYSDAACTTKIGDEPTGWEKATGETVTVTATKPEGDKAFFKVVVDDQDHSSEEQN